MKKLQINWLLWIQGLLFIAAAVLVFNAVMNIDAIFSSIRTFLSIISPVIVAAAMAYMLSRPCKWVEKLIRKTKYQVIEKRARGLAVLFVYLIVIGIIYGVLSMLLPPLMGNIIDFIDYIPTLYITIETFIRHIEWDSLNEVFNIQETVDTFFSDFDVQVVIGPVTQGLGAITNFAISTAVWLFDFFLALIISVYFLLYKDVIFETIGRIVNLIIKSENKSMLKYYIKQADDLFYKFIGAQFLDACIMGTMAVVLLLLLNVQFAVFLGIFVGVCNMIPKFGSIFATVLVVILTFITGGIALGIWTAILLTGVQQLDGNVIGPMIMGDALKINPILVFFSLLVGAAYFGILGMFLSIPVAALAKIILMNVVEAKETMTHHSDRIASKILNPEPNKGWQERYRDKKAAKKPGS